MHLKRFYVDPTDIDHEFLFLRNSQFHHAIRVLRLKKNDSFEAVNGLGFIYKAVLFEINQTYAKCMIIKRSDEVLNTRIECHMALSISKEKVMKFMSQKAAEMDVSSLQLYFSQRSQNHSKDKATLEKKRNRWLTVLKESIKQCGRPFCPEMSLIMNFSQFLKSIKQENYDHVVVLSPWTARSLSHFEKTIASSKETKILFCLGPEGGLSKTEEEALEKIGGELYHCGPILMRVETAFMFVTSVCRLWNLY